MEIIRFYVVGDAPVCVGRWRQDHNTASPIIDRWGVLKEYRKRGYGRELLKTILQVHILKVH